MITSEESKSLISAKFPEIIQVPVYMEMPVLWGDMDSAKHVNNLVYLKWSETSRIKLFEQLMDTSFDGKEGPILGWQDCKYIFPMTYPDRAIITCGVNSIEDDRFILESKIYSVKYKRLVAISKQSIIPYDYVDLKRIMLPEAWKEKLKQLSANDR